MMPDDKLHSCVEQVVEQGYDESTAYAICNAALNSKEVLQLVNEFAEGKRDNMSVLERREIPAEELELRTEVEGDGKKVSGYGIVYNRKTPIGDDFVEVIRPGAARKFLQNNPDIRCAFNHNKMYLFGRTKSGTLELEENQAGVKYTAYPPDAQWAQDAIASIERGDIDGSSFTFSVAEGGEKITRQNDGTILREIFEFDRIGELGPVTDPAYVDTTAQVRSAEESKEACLASLRAQEEEVNGINEEQRALLDRRKRWLNTKNKYYKEGENK